MAAVVKNEREMLNIKRRESSEHIKKASQKLKGRPQRRTIIPCRLVVLARYAFSSSSLSDEHSLPSSPQTLPPQSSLTLAPDLVMPKRLQVQQLVDDDLDDEVADDGEEDPLLRELRDEVKDGTSESLSLSESDSI